MNDSTRTHASCQPPLSPTLNKLMRLFFASLLQLHRQQARAFAESQALLEEIRKQPDMPEDMRTVLDELSEGLPKPPSF